MPRKLNPEFDVYVTLKGDPREMQGYTHMLDAFEAGQKAGQRSARGAAGTLAGIEHLLTNSKHVQTNEIRSALALIRKHRNV